MNKLLLILISVLSFSSAMAVTFDYPDFDEYEQISQQFVETVEALRASDEVVSIVEKAEAITGAACEVIEKESKLFMYYKLPYACGDQKLIIKARFKGDNVIVKNYTFKNL